MNDNLGWIDDELSIIADTGLMRQQTVCAPAANSTELMFDGETYVNFSNNDYLGLASDIATALEQSPALDQNWGSGASPLVTGRGVFHQKLERALADFKGSAAALLFPSGYAANVGAITAVTGAGDIIFSDARNHASIIDGCRLSRAKVEIYRHKDVDHLVELCKRAKDYRRKLIVTDALFSMDGDIAPLSLITEVARQYDSMLLVDEAHATGIYGATGRGMAQELGCEDGIDITVGTLSKALGSIGGFVSGSQQLVDLLVNKARTYIYSTAMPHTCARAGLLALECLKAEPERRDKLFKNVEYLTSRLIQREILPVRNYSQIVPVILGDTAVAMAKSKELRSAGFYIPAIRPPTVPEGESLLRISVSSAHTIKQLDGLVRALSE
ncbi:MAG: 8-amino-7-oxononanoate synthase [Planctomycetaceae bacterium]|nr:8-amino-7-oxononanoate synthase [Planctomycetaceae bacterium]